MMEHAWTFQVAWPHLDMFDSLFLPVVPEVVVNPLSNEFQWGLGPKRVLGGHVEVIHKGKELLPTNWDIHTYLCKGGIKAPLINLVHL